MDSINLDTSLTTVAGLARVVRRLFSSRALRDLEFLGVWPRRLGCTLRRQLCSVPYEVLDYESTLELKDPKGQLAVYSKREKVRFLVGGAVAFRDELWGEGKFASSYQCSPGKTVDFYREGSKHYALISLREAKHIEDIVEFNIERQVRAGFTHQMEWREVAINQPTRKLQLEVIFPRARKCLSAWIHERQERRITALAEDHFSSLPDGRQVITWEKSHPRLHELYTLRWRW